MLIWKAKGGFVKALEADNLRFGKLPLARKKSVLATLNTHRQVILWNLPEFQRKLTIDWEEGESIHVLALSADGKKLAMGGSNYQAGVEQRYGIVRLYDTQTGRKLQEWDPLMQQVFEIRFGPAGNDFFIQGRGRQQFVGHIPPMRTLHCDLLTHKEIAAAEPKAVDSMRTKLEITKDGSDYITDGDTPVPTIALWDAKTGQKTRTLFTGFGANSPTAIAISPSGGILAVAKGVGSSLTFAQIDLLELESGKTIATLKGGHRKSISVLTFSDDGHLLASGSGDTTAVIWNVEGLEKKGVP